MADETLALTQKKAIGPQVDRIGFRWLTLEKEAIRISYSALAETTVDTVVTRQELSVLPTVELTGADITKFFQNVASGVQSSPGATAGEKLRISMITTINAIARQQFDT